MRLANNNTIIHTASRARPSALPTRVHIPLISLSASDQFRRNVFSLVRTTMTDESAPRTLPVGQTVASHLVAASAGAAGLKKIAPYWYPYTTMAKQRWLGRELLEVVSTEFRDRSMEYYRYALESGVTTVNGRVAKPDTLIQNGDRIENVVHRHEPPVTSTPVKVLLHDTEREFIIVDKPGSIPVHASGRYFRNTLVEILKDDFGYEKAYTVNRLDRLTSGLMILPLTADGARTLTSEFMAGTVRKEYVARCKGRFPEDEITCEEPLLTVDRQMGLNIVHLEGKPAKTVFNLIRYDANTDSSVVRCRPFTGRSHQIRVHLQYLGHPIANDPIYSEEKIWGEKLGRGGIDTTPSQERSAPSPPPHLKATTAAGGNPESLSRNGKEDGQQKQQKQDGVGELEGTPASSSVSSSSSATATAYGEQPPLNSTTTASSSSSTKLLPRETGEDIGIGSPVPLSSEAVGVITRLRNMKDEDEDWSRWRDVVFRAKGALAPKGLEIKPPPPQNRRKRGGKAEFVHAGWGLRKAPKMIEDNLDVDVEGGEGEAGVGGEGARDVLLVGGSLEGKERVVQIGTNSTAELHPEVSAVPQLSDAEVLAKVAAEMEPIKDASTVVVEAENLYCAECYLPLHPDPKPERLYIFLHALKYTISLGEFQTDMPEWAAEGWTWDRS